jgi:hypothetical protein
LIHPFALYYRREWSEPMYPSIRKHYRYFARGTMAEINSINSNDRSVANDLWLERTRRSEAANPSQAAAGQAVSAKNNEEQQEKGNRLSENEQGGISFVASSGDQVDISAEAVQRLKDSTDLFEFTTTTGTTADTATGQPEAAEGTATSAEASASPAQEKAASDESSGELTSEEQQEVKKLQSRDREVRAHEQAHIAAGGNLVKGAASFQYETGPDGKHYAVGGEVQIDTSPVKNDPAATIRKAQQIQRAAKAPVNPSGQDEAVAAAAQNMEMEAEQELRQEQSGVAKSGTA